MSGTVISRHLQPAQQDDPHEEYGLLMSMALDHLLDSDEEDALHRHLSSCQACSRQWQIWQTIDDQFQWAPVIAPPVDFVQQVTARLENQGKGQNVRVGIVLAVLTLTIWAVGVAGVALVLGFLIYSQIESLNETLQSVAYIWTMVRIVGESTWRAALGLGENPSAIGALLTYVTLSVALLAGWMQFLRRSIRPWDRQPI